MKAIKAKSRLRRTPDYYYYRGSRATAPVMLATTILLGIFSMGFGHFSEMIKTWNEVAEVQADYQKPLIIDTRETNISSLIDDAVNEFLPDHKSESLMIMHCLAHRESGHGASNAHGDNGMAGGPFQFWEDTWNRMRKQMIKQGAATEIGSRYDLKEAVRTTAWAIKEGRALEWGPLKRNSEDNHFADCQFPSWY